jgi:hypothetical protein
VGEDDSAGQDGVVIGHVGVIELRPVLQLNFQPAAEFLGVDFHFLDINFSQDGLGFLNRHFRAFQLSPVAEA